MKFTTKKLITKKPQKSPLTLRMDRLNREIRTLRIKLFLLITLPVAVVTIGQAVLKEYTKIRVRQAASAAGNGARKEEGKEPENSKKETSGPQE